MAAITTAQSGNWNAESTWTGGTIPVAGDTVTIANGHTVTVPSGYVAVCGDSPENDTSTPALQCNGTTGTGVLVVNGTFRFRGSVRQGPVQWTVNAGGRLEYDNSQTSTKPLYTWGIGRATGQLDAILRLIGEAGNRVVVTNAPGSDRCGGFWTANNHDDRSLAYSRTYTGCGNIIADYTDVIDLGVSATNGFWYYARFTSAGLQQFIFRNSRIIGCSYAWHQGNLDAAAVYHLKNTSVLDPVSAIPIVVYDDREVTTGYRLIEGCVIENEVRIYNARTAFEIRDSALAGPVDGGAPLNSGLSVASALTLKDSMLFNRNLTGQGDSNVPAVVERVLSLRADAGGDDDHFRGNMITAAGLTIDGLVAEYNGPRDHGEITVLNSLAAGVTAPVNAVYKNIIVVPNREGSPSGSIVALVVGAKNFLVNVQNCTFPATQLDAGSSCIFYTEMAQMANAGTVVSIANNILYAPDGQGSQYGYIQGGTLVGYNNTPDGFFVDVDYNCHYNAATDVYVSPDSKFATAPGQNDLNVDPGFTDWGRNFLGWAQTIDSDIETWAEAWAEMRKRNDDTGYDSRWNWQDAYNWIREGYTPTNAVLATGGKDGTYIGAVEFSGTPVAPTINEFTATPSSGEYPLEVTFYFDVSGSTLTATSINPGDGSAAITFAPWTHTYTDEGEYTATLTVTNEAGSDTDTAAVTVTEHVLVAPDAPTDLTATDDSVQGRIALAWTAPAAGDPLDGYNVYRDDVLIAETTGTSLTDTPPLAGTEYAYSVTAYNAAGESDPATATGEWNYKELGVLGTPAASDGKYADRVMVSVPAVGNALEYRILRDSDQVRTWGAGRVYTDATVTPDVEYSYTYEARNPDYTSDESAADTGYADSSVVDDDSGNPIKPAIRPAWRRA